MENLVALSISKVNIFFTADRRRQVQTGYNLVSCGSYQKQPSVHRNRLFVTTLIMQFCQHAMKSRNSGKSIKKIFVAVYKNQRLKVLSLKTLEYAAKTRCVCFSFSSLQVSISRVFFSIRISLFKNSAPRLASNLKT